MSAALAMLRAGDLFALLSVLLTTAVQAQQITDEPGSPSAATTVDGKYLPSPPAEFGVQIGLSAEASKSNWPAQIVPPKGTPKVLLIMTDDAGYGVFGTFGGIIATPALDRVAKALQAPADAAGGCSVEKRAIHHWRASGSRTPTIFLR